MGINSVVVAAACVLLAAGMNPAAAGPGNAQDIGQGDATSRLIVKLRPAVAAETVGQQPAETGARFTVQSKPSGHRDRAQRLAEKAGLGVRAAREIGPGMAVLDLGKSLAEDQLTGTLAALRADPEIEFAEVDRRRYIRALPNDLLYPSQWYLQGGEVAATNFETAWDTTTGQPGTVVAVLDTGVRFEHPDLSGRLLPGYDFVSGESPTSFASANDGNAWDSNASDPGDWVSPAESQSGPLAGCDTSDSSWHGTRVAGMVGAATNNVQGIAGGTWAGKVLPVRVLGKCGGYDSDIVSGMRWAAGLSVSGVPTNPNPARILNLSLGSADSCSATYRSVITELTQAGVLVISSAGNDSGPVEAPANCPGILAVGGLRHVGTKVGYSSLGPEVGVSAPAGNCPDVNTTLLCGYSLVTSDNTGITVPGSSSYTDDANYNIGTSFSAPIVAGVAALMDAVNGGLTTSEFIARLKAGTRPFPPAEPGLPTCPSLDSETAQCNCTTSTCGAGIAYAPGAVAHALRPMARIAAPGEPSANVILDGSSSDAARNRTISSFLWTTVSGSPTFVGPTSGPTASVVVPETGPVTVRLNVTDDAGRTDAQDVSLPAAPDSQAPSAPGGLAATPSSGQIGLSWAPSTDNVGVTNYLIERCTGVACATFFQIAMSTGTTYSNNSLVPETSYSYRVRAQDAADNVSAFSATATATTPVQTGGGGGGGGGGAFNPLGLLVLGLLLRNHRVRKRS